MTTNPVDLAIARLAADPATEGAAADTRLLVAELRAARDALAAQPELWTCPVCAFTFDACHQYDTPEGGYSCPACAEPRLQAEAAALRAALEYLTSCDHGQDLDCPRCEPVPDLVRQALEGTAGRAVAAELLAGRAVVEAARVVGDEDLDETDVTERLACAIDAYDATVKKGAPQ
ncbi:MAG TPA: hypothetical protein VE664_08645 [Actinomycetes bacterium]|jgi:hypothetical protein|nr:hypothetical protein [Actinomycetes bacterium]